MQRRWHIHHAGNSRRDWRNLNRRFQVPAGWHFRAGKLRYWYRSPSMVVIVALGAFGICSWLLNVSPSTPKTTPLHVGYVRNCAAARAMGIAPIYRGQPGYAPHLDRDDDGIACEPYPFRW
jgi:hypothetical protein